MKRTEFDFDAFWSSGTWRKLGKEQARKLFAESIKTEEAWRDIQRARDAYAEHCRREAAWYTPMLGSVWFGKRKGWRDWVPDEDERVEAIEDDHSGMNLNARAAAIQRQLKLRLGANGRLPTVEQIKERLKA